MMSPLKLSSSVKRPSRSFVGVPFIDVLLIGFFLLMFGGRFISAPGVVLDLPKVSGAGMQVGGAPRSVAVLSVKSRHMILFDGGIYSLDGIDSVLREFVKSKPVNGGGLLIKVDKSADIETLVEVCDRAKEVGFGFVQLAVNMYEDGIVS